MSMESQAKTQQNPGNAQVIANQNTPGPAPALSLEGINQARSSAIPLMSQQHTPLANASTYVQGSLPSIGQSLPGVSQTSTLQNMSGMQQRLQTSAGMLLQQNNIDQQKQYIQAQRGLQDVSSSASVNSNAQTGHLGAGDFQEELYQMIKSLKDAELSDLYNKISIKLQHVDNRMPPQMSSDKYEKMKAFKALLERTLHFLQISKSNIQPGLRGKIPIYEKQIVNILNSQRRLPVQAPVQQPFQQSGGQAPSSNISQQHQPSQGMQQHGIHSNQMPQASLPSMSTGVQSSSAPGIQHVPVPQTTNFGFPTTQQNIMNAPQAGSNLDSTRGNNFNPVQHGSMGAALQHGSTGPMQGFMNAQQQLRKVVKLRCHFCKKGGHFKKDCLKKIKWFEKKGMAYDPTHKWTKNT